MPTPTEILKPISGGRVLDVATGSGGFIHFLQDGLTDYTEIIGVDNNERAAAAFAEAFKGSPNIRFIAMDAARLDFEPASFDLVCISNSLHHFDDPLVILDQMDHVLRPGGHFMVAEMYRDGQTETQMTHVHLHHWWGAVDRANGIVHHETYPRQALVNLVTGLGLNDLTLFDLSETDEDPKNPEILAQLNPVFERYHQRAEGYPELQARGGELRQRVADIGFHSAASLIALGAKPSR